MALSAKSKKRIASYENDGWKIIYGNHSKLNKSVKWAGHKCIMIVRSNGVDGSVIVWAIKDNNQFEIDSIQELIDLDEDRIEYYRNVTGLILSGQLKIQTFACEELDERFRQTRLAELQDSIQDLKNSIAKKNQKIAVLRAKPYEDLPQGIDIKSSGKRL